MPVPSATEKREPDVQVEELLARVRKAHGDKGADLVREAYEFAQRTHGDQRRRSGEEYVSHPLSVAEILADLQLDATSLAVALLHDVLEDTPVTREEMAERFGEEITRLVEGVTKIGQMEFTSTLEEQAVNFRKLLLAMVEDARVLLVKLADRLHNMRTLVWLNESAQGRIASETAEIYAPLAHRLGMGRVQQELEDLSFRYLEPEAFLHLGELVAGRLDAVRSFTAQIQGQIESEMETNEIPCRVFHRVKGMYSLYRKMEAREVEIEQVYDLIAFRIITDTVRNCYGSLGIIHNRWNPVPGRFKDLIAMPKRNMYQSLHTTMLDRGRPFEVQIRTEEMHRVAEEGIAAHWVYKEGGGGAAEETQPMAWLRQLVEAQGEVQDPREFLSSLKLNLYPDEVYVFTPRGDVRSLPRGATPIDFAYLIHTEVGHHCTGAKVNGKLVQLRRELRNGDIVEIVTNAEASPSRDWLKIVTTTRARNRVRNFLNRQERERSVDLGRKMCEKEFRKYGLRLKTVMADGTMERVAGQLGLAGAEDLLVAVSFGKVGTRPLVERILPAEDVEKRRPENRSRLRRIVDRAMGWNADGAISVRGIDDVLVYRARCCGPVPGEPIIGYVTRGKGVSIHATNCGNIARMLQEEDRRIEVYWKGDSELLQPVRLHVEVDDRPGMLAAITSKIAEEGSNIGHIESKRSEPYRMRIDLVVDVVDRTHLRRIFSALNSIEGVRGTRRGRAP